MAAKSVSSFVLFSLALMSLSISDFVSLWAQCVREGELGWLAGSEVSVTVWGGDGQSSPTLRKQRTHMQELAWLSPFLSDPTPALQLTECVSVCWVCATLTCTPTPPLPGTDEINHHGPFLSSV